MTHPPEMPDPFPFRHRITGEPIDRDGRILTNEEKAIVRKSFEADYLRRMDEHYGVIKSLDELKGFRILGLSRYKPGVVRYVAVSGSSQRTGFAADEVFASVQLPE